MNSFAELFIKETIKVFLQQKYFADKALEQLQDDAEFFQIVGERSHSVAITVKHVSGNLRSRWTDFLITDGEKEYRNRENEFIILTEDSRIELMKNWEMGWNILTNSLQSLTSNDFEKTIYIRKEPHSIPLAIQRSLAHTSYHVGQILYISRLVKNGEWKWLTIAPGKSNNFNEDMNNKYGNK